MSRRNELELYFRRMALALRAFSHRFDLEQDLHAESVHAIAMHVSYTAHSLFFVHVLSFADSAAIPSPSLTFPL